MSMKKILFIPLVILVNCLMVNGASAGLVKCSGLITASEAKKMNQPVSVRIVEGRGAGRIVNIRLPKGRTISSLHSGEVIKSPTHGMMIKIESIRKVRMPCGRGYQVTASTRT